MQQAGQLAFWERAALAMEKRARRKCSKQAK
jgi:hypothetical protein